MSCILAGDAPCVKTGRATHCNDNSRTFLTIWTGAACQCMFQGVILRRNEDCRGRPQLRAILGKFAAVAALLALFLPGVSSLAEALSAANLPACCTTAYCPVHHRQLSALQKDKGNCDSIGMPGQNDCSMRACDSAPRPVVGTTAYLLATSLVLRGPVAQGAAISVASQFFPFAVTIPLTPPPRTFLS